MGPNPFQHAMQWGLLMGLLMLLNFILSGSDNGVVAALSYLVEGGVIFLTYYATVHYRTTQCDNRITFSAAYSYVLLLFFFGSLLSGVLRLLYMKYIDPTYLDEMYARVLRVVDQMQLDMPEDAQLALEKLMQPVRFNMNYMMTDIFLGSLLGLVVAGLCRKKPKEDGLQ